ncbi:deoxyribose-phosphate aldolase [Seonamhaeicola sp. MEBiC1930]|uniref:deoxyribose-phosphate aldolase n=1 Tax=Seonamhaeicola sp. MEBiC01930 TaxID=2976768 RepID=UPI003249F853
MNIFEHIEFTQLNPATTERDIIDLCLLANEQQLRTVCVNSSYVSLTKELLNNNNIGICSVIGFPFGATDTASKIHEAQAAIANGASEIDMVINLGLLKSRNYVSVLKDISDVKLAIGTTPLKVTLEVSELNKNEIIKACQICMDAKVDYIKTSTGFSKSGVTLTVIKIIKKTIKNTIKICAFHGIDDEETAFKYLDLGVDRIGVSSEFKIRKVAA